MENFIAGIYLKSSRTFKLGQKVRIDEVEGSIKSISNQGVTIKTDFSYNSFIPNRVFVKKEISFRNIEIDLDTLEKIKTKGQRLEASTLVKAMKMHLENKLDVRWRKVHIKSK